MSVMADLREMQENRDRGAFEAAVRKRYPNAVLEPDPLAPMIYTVQTPETSRTAFEWRDWAFQGRTVFSSEHEARETAEGYCANRFRIVKTTREVVYEEPRIGR